MIVFRPRAASRADARRQGDSALPASDPELNRRAGAPSGIKIWFLVGIALVSVAQGFLASALAPGLPQFVLYGSGALTSGILMFAWYRRDAREHDYRRSRGLDSALIAALAVALPYYLIRSRGWRRGLLVSGGFVVFSVACLVLYGGALLVGLPGGPQAEQITEYPDRGSDELSYRRTVSPNYPFAMIAQGNTGTAHVAVRVGADGKPSKVSLQQGTGHLELDEEALRAVSQWEFYPRIVDGVAVEADAVLPIVFELD